GLVAVIAPPAILTASSTVHRTSEMAKGYSNMPRQVKTIKVPALALLMPSAYVLCIRENLRKTRAGIRQETARKCPYFRAVLPQQRLNCLPLPQQQRDFGS